MYIYISLSLYIYIYYMKCPECAENLGNCLWTPTILVVDHFPTGKAVGFPDVKSLEGFGGCSPCS